MSITTYEQHCTASPIQLDCEKKLTKLKHSGIGDEHWNRLQREEKFAYLHEAVGNTPLEEVILPNGAVIRVKQELDNPSGSHYDRAYLETIEKFEKDGFLLPGDELRDITSGSAGISLALIGSLLGYKVRITVPSELPESRLFPIRYFGAEVVSSGLGYVPGSSAQQVREIVDLRENQAWQESRPADRSGRSFLFQKGNDRICYLNHSENDLSPQAFESIAKEILVQAPDASHIALAEGNWTTINGIARYLKAHAPHVKIIGYSGELTNGSTENFGTNVPDVPIRFRDLSLLDQDVVVTNQQRDTMGSYAPHLGRSSLMGLFVAQSITSLESAAKVITIGYDEIVRY